MLTLPIDKKWFDMILSGEKKEEYREIKPYWTKRFYNKLYDLVVIRNEDNKIACIEYARGTVTFKNGYKKNAPKIECYIELNRRYGKAEWGAEPNKLYCVLKILSVEEMK